MKETKYYQPQIEEFHVGFEYEKYESRNWEKCAITLWTDLKSLFDLEDKCPIPLRVRYLDQDDIESFGFRNIIRGECKPQIWYLDVDIKEYREEYTGCIINTHAAKTHIVLCTKLLLGMEDTYKEKLIFAGKINNRSELKRVLKQLEII